MKVAARELGVNGACVALISLKDSPFPCSPVSDFQGRFHRDPDSSKGQGDTGANYLSVAYAKLFQMLRTGQNSGPDSGEPAKGEFTYKGGVMKDVGSYNIYTAFSGGTEEQDLVIAQVGLEELERSLAYYLVSRGEHAELSLLRVGLLLGKTFLRVGIWLFLSITIMLSVSEHILTPIFHQAIQGSVTAQVVFLLVGGLGLVLSLVFGWFLTRFGFWISSRLLN